MPMTIPFGLLLNLPFALVSLTAISDHEPGDAPQSITVWPGCKIFVRSLISISLKALRHLEIEQCLLKIHVIAIRMCASQ